MLPGSLSASSSAASSVNGLYYVGSEEASRLMSQPVVVSGILRQLSQAGTVGHLQASPVLSAAPR